MLFKKTRRKECRKEKEEIAMLLKKSKKERVEERKRRDCYNIAWSRQDQQMQC